MNTSVASAVGALGPQAIGDLVLKVLAVAGGAALGAILTALVGQVAVRLLSGGKMPPWARRVLHAVGAVAFGWLVAYLVFRGLGPGGPGEGGGKEGNDAGKGAQQDQREKEPPRPNPDQTNPRLVRVEVLGPEALKALNKPEDVANRGAYRIEDDPDHRLYDLEGIKGALREKHEKSPALKVELIIYEDSPDKDHPRVWWLEEWLRKEGLWKTYVTPGEHSPEVKKARRGKP